MISMEDPLDVMIIIKANVGHFTEYAKTLINLDGKFVTCMSDNGPIRSSDGHE